MINDIQQCIEMITPEIYEKLKTAVELRKWPDGRVLDEHQVSLCLEAIIRYENTGDVPMEDRVGYIDRSSCRSNAKR